MLKTYGLFNFYMNSKKELTAPCGIDCFNCEIYKENITEAIKERLSLLLSLPAVNISCNGCREQNGCPLHNNTCKTLDCVKEKGFEFCSDCDEFPCNYLHPASEGADKYPHNLKMYNLCRIKLLGFEKWAEEASENRKRYFKGKFEIGSGPGLN